MTTKPKKQKLLKILSIMGFIFMIALGIGYFKTLDSRGEVIEHSALVSPDFAREFHRVTTKNRKVPFMEVDFLNPDGKKTGWHDFKGQYLLVNFWATWCPPCVVELPSLNDLQERYEGTKLTVIAISLDKQRNQKQIKNFLYNRDIDEFAAYWDGMGDINNKIVIRGLPTTYLLDPQGNILHIFEGDADWDSHAGIDFFNALLAPPNIDKNTEIK